MIYAGNKIKRFSNIPSIKMICSRCGLLKNEYAEKHAHELGVAFHRSCCCGCFVGDVCSHCGNDLEVPSTLELTVNVPICDCIHLERDPKNDDTLSITNEDDPGNDKNTVNGVYCLVFHQEYGGVCEWAVNTSPDEWLILMTMFTSYYTGMGDCYPGDDFKSGGFSSTISVTLDTNDWAIDWQHTRIILGQSSSQNPFTLKAFVGSTAKTVDDCNSNIVINNTLTCFAETEINSRTDINATNGGTATIVPCACDDPVA